LLGIVKSNDYLCNKKLIKHKKKGNMDQNKAICKKLSFNGDRVNEVTVEGKGIYRWNPIYCTYNSINDNSLLMDSDVKNIVGWSERVNPSESESMNIVDRIHCKMIGLQGLIVATQAVIDELSDKISERGDYEDSEKIDVHEQSLMEYEAQMKILQEVLDGKL
jgi:hypothetical protein